MLQVSTVCPIFKHWPLKKPRLLPQIDSDIIFLRTTLLLGACYTRCKITVYVSVFAQRVGL